ncbi:MAG: hypothetical protein GEU99_02450 [Luteitalea sp.]|nr:hypothetical protein [Luteitalea sp.]
MNTNPTTVGRHRRNEPCHCGSGRKYKQCCLERDEAEARAARAKAAAEEPQPSPEAASAPARTSRPQMHQPWKKTATRGFFQRVRTPRKVGGG